MRRKTGWFLLALSAVLLCCGIALSAGTDGRIAVKLKPQSGEKLPEGTYTVTLYRIGEEDTDALTGWTMTEPFGELVIQAGMKAEDVRQLAEQALMIIRKEGTAPVDSGKAGFTREIRFDGLTAGIYLGEISTKTKGMDIQPFVVALSDREPGKTNAAEVNPKYEYTPEPTPTRTKKPTPTPTGTETPSQRPTASPTTTPNAKPVRLTIWYIYWDGRTAAPTYRHIYWPGDDYDVVSPVIPGYTATMLRVSGTMPDRDMEYTVIYIPENSKLIPIEDYSIPLGLGEIYMHVGVCFE